MSELDDILGETMINDEITNNSLDGKETNTSDEGIDRTSSESIDSETEFSLTEDSSNVESLEDTSLDQETDEATEESEEDPEKPESSNQNMTDLLKRCWNWVCFFLLGFINNVPYSLGIASAQSLSYLYDQSSNYGFIVWACIFLGFFTQLSFTLFLHRINHHLMFLISGFSFIMSVGGVVLCILIFGEGSEIGFWLTVCCILGIGGTCSFGLSLVFKYLTLFDNDPMMSRFVLSGVGAGTGMSGLGGTGFYLLFNSIFEQGKSEESEEKNIMVMKNTNIFMFSVLIPLIVLYMLIPFFCVIPPKGKIIVFRVFDFFKNRNSVTNEEEKEEEEEKRKSDQKEEMNHMPLTERLKDVFQGIWFVGTNTLLIYFSGYLIQTGIGEKMFDYSVSNNSEYYAERHFYVIQAFLFRFGIFFSRTVSMLFQSSKKFLLILTCIQLTFMCVWFTLAKTKVFSNYYFVWFLFPMITCGGLVSGFEYVNAYYIIMNLVKFKSEKSKEIAVYVNMLMEDLGIVICSITTIFLQKTVLSE